MPSSTLHCTHRKIRRQQHHRQQQQLYETPKSPSPKRDPHDNPNIFISSFINTIHRNMENQDDYSIIYSMVSRRRRTCTVRYQPILVVAIMIIGMMISTTTTTTTAIFTAGFLVQTTQHLQKQLQQDTIPSSSSFRPHRPVSTIFAVNLKQRLEQQHQQLKQRSDNADSSAAANTETLWFPIELIDTKDEIIESVDADTVEHIQNLAINLTAQLIRSKLYPTTNDNSETESTAPSLEEGGDSSEPKNDEMRNSDSQKDGVVIDSGDTVTDTTIATTNSEPSIPTEPIDAVSYAYGRFLDLCGSTRRGEQALEGLFEQELAIHSTPTVVQGAVLILQRLCVLGMTYGLTMNAYAIDKSTTHMTEPYDDDDGRTKEYFEWTSDSTRRLKRNALRNESIKWPAIQLLAALNKRQSSLGAYELLLKLGAWQPHENLALIRSGVALRFSDAENDAAARAQESTIVDPDQLLGLRQDFRPFKVFTIDGPGTSEIDDGLSVEKITDKTEDTTITTGRYRYWIHIADADRWAPRQSEVFRMARKRATSIYLPDQSISMIPSQISSHVMSLQANTDSCALSLGVELDDDGNVIDDSIIVTPSTVRVTYGLTYDQVNEMLEDGVAYKEEWELGQLYTAAKTRQRLRYQNGNSEQMVPTKIPQYTISVYNDPTAPDKIGIKVNVELGNNTGKNQSAIVGDTTQDITTNNNDNNALVDEAPVSAANILVTEMMILAGEAIGRWAQRVNGTITTTGRDDDGNYLQLPFRSQSPPNYKTRSHEKKIMMDLLEYNVGGGYCHAWYARRFLSPVTVSPVPNPHSGLGLPCYVQWTSPIRRFQDLQAHAAVKRYLRRQRIMELLQDGQPIPFEVTPVDLGCELVSIDDDDDNNEDGSVRLRLDSVVDEIDYKDRTKLIGPVVFVQRHSQKYWMLEYLRRLHEKDPSTELDVLVLGCVNPAKRQYAIYVYGLGLEWRYSSPVGLQAGQKFKVRISNVAPNNGQLLFARIQ
ncbi:exoribonuclease II [Nitzschia inconspicua]|uniref:Exoribonuclease II n=1 Tax=Nitzschia inconspicua TaxID=303405 RepID=A0A9K3Q405_9STRA|nr:exoribonuclease II [Nitzschia inconspicua]